MYVMLLYTRVVPIETAGCYVPGGLYGYVATTAMTAATAKAAGVKNIICTAPSNKKTGKIHPTTLYGMKKAGATQILALGGIQVPDMLYTSITVISTIRISYPTRLLSGIHNIYHILGTYMVFTLAIT